MIKDNDNYSNALPVDYMLDNFKIIRILGAGGFGIAYLAEDTYLEEKYVIKEYMPSEFSYRDLTSHSLYATSPSHTESYEWGLKEFLNEAKTIKKCQHHNVVKVVRFFEANNTAYMVMPYFEGGNLSEFLQAHSNKSLTETELKAIIIPLLDGLKVLHAQNIFHRDIKPSNIYICDEDNRPILIDFGAARFSLGAQSCSITTIVSVGYSPHEQYHQHGRQGAWTDIYSMAAVMYYLISGKKPIEAPARVTDDPLVPATVIGKGKYSPHLLAAIDHALAFSEKDRPQSIEEWLIEMNGQEEQEPPEKTKLYTNPHTTSHTNTRTDQKPTSSMPMMAWIAIATLLVGFVVLASILFYPKDLEPVDPKPIALKPMTPKPVELTPSVPKPVDAKPIPTKLFDVPPPLKTCVDGRLNSAQIQALVYNKTAIGTRLDTSVPYDWKESQMKNGDASFSKKNGTASTGKWKVDNDQLCWCYGECISYQCKYVESSNACSIWYYINPETEKKTSKIYKWQTIK